MDELVGRDGVDDVGDGAGAPEAVELLLGEPAVGHATLQILVAAATELGSITGSTSPPTLTCSDPPASTGRPVASSQTASATRTGTTTLPSGPAPICRRRHQAVVEKPRAAVERKAQRSGDDHQSSQLGWQQGWTTAQRRNGPRTGPTYGPGGRRSSAIHVSRSTLLGRPPGKVSSGLRLPR